MCCGFLREDKQAWMREGKETEYNVCIAEYYNTKSLRNTRFDGQEALLLEKVWKQLRYHYDKNK